SMTTPIFTTTEQPSTPTPAATPSWSLNLKRLTRTAFTSHRGLCSSPSSSSPSYPSSVDGSASPLPSAALTRTVTSSIPSSPVAQQPKVQRRPATASNLALPPSPFLLLYSASTSP